MQLHLPPLCTHRCCSTVTGFCMVEPRFGFWTNNFMGGEAVYQHRVRSYLKGCGRGFHAHQLLVVQQPYKGSQAVVNSGKIASNGNEEDPEIPPTGCTRIKLELTKPLGIVLEEDKAGNIFVAEVIRDGNADKSGLVDVGDQLISTSAVVYGTEDYYQGVMVRKGMQIVRLSVRSEKFETVMAAIGTHPAYIKVALEIQKCKPTTSRGEYNGPAIDG